jgi:hypothetical protein
MNRYVLAIVGFCIAAPASAHHAFNAYDRTQEIVVTGTVKEWDWVNPHAILRMSVVQPNGEVAEYVFEGYSPLQLPSRGITRNMVKVGEKLTVKYFPRKDGTNGGQLEAVVPPTDSPSDGAK